MACAVIVVSFDRVLNVITGLDSYDWAARLRRFFVRQLLAEPASTGRAEGHSEPGCTAMELPVRTPYIIFRDRIVRHP